MKFAVKSYPLSNAFSEDLSFLADSQHWPNTKVICSTRFCINVIMLVVEPCPFRVLGYVFKNNWRILYTHKPHKFCTFINISGKPRSVGKVLLWKTRRFGKCSADFVPAFLNLEKKSNIKVLPSKHTSMVNICIQNR